MARILLIEDHHETAAAISIHLSHEGHVIDHVADGNEGLEWLTIRQYDLAIVDWELPGLSGRDICQSYRGRNGQVPLLMLTGRSDVSDRIDGLDAGADDYMGKPFSLKELSSRVRAILRRPPVVQNEFLECGELKLDLSNHIAYKGDLELTLAPRDFALLEFFMRNQNLTFSTEALLQRVWNNDENIGSDALRTAIKRIRKVIDAPDDANSLIENVPRVGYRLRIRK